MLIKVDNYGNIVKHDVVFSEETPICVYNQDIIELDGQYAGAYKYKYINGQLISLTDLEKKNHVCRIRAELIKIRAERDQKLADTDWLMVVDSPASDDCIESYKEYRQLLRDFPETITDVDSLVWPIKPQYIAKA